ncbi:hypothetical protein TIFTF001_009067 [Ficus carica]|uniref:Uncharacterized protein n=1 Tax=Ficus carica TaxID=3494 RepID=A0AA87ZMH0_FICCA|nr:hypothetical protein TIFTF001_009067 [Ficus carica]
MAFRGREMMKNIVKKVGEKNLTKGTKESLKKFVPDSNIVMNRAKRGIFAGKHIRFGNRVSEDGGNNNFIVSVLELSYDELVFDFIALNEFGMQCS